MSNKTQRWWRRYPLFTLPLTVLAVGLVAMVVFPEPEDGHDGTCWMILILLVIHMGRSWTIPTRQ